MGNKTTVPFSTVSFKKSLQVPLPHFHTSTTLYLISVVKPLQLAKLLIRPKLRLISNLGLHLPRVMTMHFDPFNIGEGGYLAADYNFDIDFSR